MERAEAAPIRVQVDGRETESDSFQEYRGLYQLWIRPESADHPRASISISYYLLPTNREAGRVLKSILGNYSMIMRRRPVTNPPEVGDTSFGRYPGTTLFIRGRAIISIMIQLAAPLPPDIERSEIAALVDPTVEATVRRLDELGLESRPPLQVDMLVLSRHVNAARKDAVRLRLSSSEHPTDYSFSCYRVDDLPLPGTLGDLFYKERVVGQEGDLDFTWQGRDDAGNPVPNGRYRLYIQARDPLRRMKAFHVDVQVNNQGGK